MSPMHSWTSVSTAYQYKVQYDEVGEDFSTPVYESSWVTGLSYRPIFSTLGDYDWRIFSRDIAGNEGPSSVVRTISLIEGIPAAPVLGLPAANAATTDNTPTFGWSSPTWAESYEIQIDDQSNFASPAFTQNGITLHTATSTLVDNGTYYWRVRAYNALGEPGAWSPARLLRIVP
jgi:hypothetical protein